MFPYWPNIFPYWPKVFKYFHNLFSSITIIIIIIILKSKMFHTNRLCAVGAGWGCRWGVGRFHILYEINPTFDNKSTPLPVRFVVYIGPIIYYQNTAKNMDIVISILVFGLVLQTSDVNLAALEDICVYRYPSAKFRNTKTTHRVFVTSQPFIIAILHHRLTFWTETAGSANPIKRVPGQAQVTSLLTAWQPCESRLSRCVAHNGQQCQCS